MPVTDLAPDYPARVAHRDSMDWARDRWVEAGEPDAERFVAAMALLRLSGIVGTGLDRALKDHDTSRTGFLILCTLRIATDQSLTMSQLSKRLVLHATTISLVVDQLQERGLVTRSQHPSDKRTVLATLTPKGAKALHKINLAVCETGYGLDGVDERLAIMLTEVIRYARNALGDD
jgi:DNA-binding MarR family transcriptional regulator